MKQDYSHAAISGHCRKQLVERHMPVEALMSVLTDGDEVLASAPERIILQKVVLTEGKPYLWRVVIDVLQSPPRVITAYRTSKLKKYVKEH
ncbi:MAG: DUF4258 domain-containing protein [Alphaproteobacteria bacterium]|nr:DUF4258 domain-containing protein [Alphaproteobacteria bacterium]